MSDTPTLVIPGITDPATLACIARSRKFKQFCKAIEDALAGRCAFCQLNPEYNKLIDLPNVGRLHVWPCNPPEKFTRLHFIIAPKRHVLNITDLNYDEWTEVRYAISDLENKFGFKFAGILCRNGDATESAGTIQHLHIHVMVPDGTGRVESPFCKTPEEELEGVKRAIVFEKIRAGGGFTTLNADEQKLVEGRL